MNKNFDFFKELYSTINFKFSIACFSEIWLDDISFSKNSEFSTFRLPGLTSSKKNRKEEFVFLCMKLLALN